MGKMTLTAISSVSTSFLLLRGPVLLFFILLSELSQSYRCLGSLQLIVKTDAIA